MSRLGIEPRSPRPLTNSLTNMPHVLWLKINLVFHFPRGWEVFFFKYLIKTSYLVFSFHLFFFLISIFLCCIYMINIEIIAEFIYCKRIKNTMNFKRENFEMNWNKKYSKKTSNLLLDMIDEFRHQYYLTNSKNSIIKKKIRQVV